MFVLKKEKGICFVGMETKKGGRGGRGGHGNVAGGGCARVRGGRAGSGGMGQHCLNRS